MTKEILKNKKKKYGFDEIGNRLTRVYYFNDDNVNKPFGLEVQSGVGGIGYRTSLISWRLDQSRVGSIFSTKIPHSVHVLSEVWSK